MILKDWLESLKVNSELSRIFQVHYLSRQVEMEMKFWGNVQLELIMFVKMIRNEETMRMEIKGR